MPFGNVELIHRVLLDTVPEELDAVCLFGETTENETLQLKTIASLAPRAKFVAVSGFDMEHDPKQPVSGFAAWRRRLNEEFGVPSVKIRGYKLSNRFPPCTDAEAWGLVEYADAEGWERVAIVVPPLHAIRAFVSTVSAVVKLKSRLRVYSHPSTTPDWTEETLHSQSAPRAIRSTLLAGEFEKMQRYYENGDHISTIQVLEYLDWR